MRAPIRPIERLFPVLGTLFVALGFIEVVAALRSGRSFDFRVVMSSLGLTGLGVGLVRRGSRSRGAVAVSVILGALCAAALAFLGRRG